MIEAAILQRVLETHGREQLSTLAMPTTVVLLTPGETATLLGISSRTLARWNALRVGPPRINSGRRPRSRMESPVKWLDANEAHPRRNFDGTRYTGG